MLGCRIRKDVIEVDEKKRIIRIVKNLSAKNGYSNYCVLGTGDIARNILSIVVRNRLHPPAFFVGRNAVFDNLAGFPIRSPIEAFKDSVKNVLVGPNEEQDLGGDLGKLFREKKLHNFCGDVPVGDDVILQENAIPSDLRETVFKRIRHFADLGENYCLYGTGRTGCEILSIAIQNELLLPSFFVDHLCGERDKLYGIDLFLPSVLSERHIDNVLLGSTDFQSEMKQILPEDIKANILNFREVKNSEIQNTSSCKNRFCLSTGFRIHMDGSIVHCCLSKSQKKPLWQISLTII